MTYTVHAWLEQFHHFKNILVVKLIMVTNNLVSLVITYPVELHNNVVYFKK